MDEGYTKMVRRCRRCTGQGVIASAGHCGLCQTPAEAVEEPSGAEPALPCGHDGHYLAYERLCPECQGDGRSEQWLSPAEMAAIRRGRLARAAFVALLSISTLLILTNIIWASSGRDPLCGYWWYWLLPTFLLGQIRTK